MADHSWLEAPDQPGFGTLRVPVTKVTDGDGFASIVQWDNERTKRAAVRFGFIDAPEIDQRGGIEARDHLRNLITGQWVNLGILLKTDTGRTVDYHGRIVAVPYLRQLPDAVEGILGSATRFLDALPLPVGKFRNIELEMVLNGWAWVMNRYGPDERYLDALSDARRHKRGIWALNDNVPPWEFKRQKRLNPRPKPMPIPAGARNCPMPECDGTLRTRHGRYGLFLGCSNFPRCKHSENENAH